MFFSIKRQETLEEIQQEFFEVKRKMTHENPSIETVIELSEEYGFTKALYADYKSRYKYLITQNN